MAGIACLCSHRSHRCLPHPDRDPLDLPWPNRGFLTPVSLGLREQVLRLRVQKAGLECGVLNGDCDPLLFRVQLGSSVDHPQGFQAELFPGPKLRVLGLGLSGKATVTNLVSANPAVHREAYRNRGPRTLLVRKIGVTHVRRRIVERRERHWRTGPRCPGELFGRGVETGSPNLASGRCATVLSPPDAAFEAVQERGSRRALPSVLDVQLDRLADTLKLLMSNSVPETLVFVRV
ncbi:hypothetical protein DPEC_G00380370 [Dallia pectoralis]|nr:hypothetical protein DPEC_G00380370 [Dallia pectoralis]